MSPPAESVLKQALALPQDERAKLAAQLLASLEEPEPTEDQAVVDQLWSDEIDARIAELEADPSIAIDSRTAIARARAAIRQDKA